jgi:hypothetical protein
MKFNNWIELDSLRATNFIKNKTRNYRTEKKIKIIICKKKNMPLGKVQQE